MKLISFRRFKSVCNSKYHWGTCLHKKHPDSRFYEAGHPMNEFGKCCAKKCPEWKEMKDAK